MAQTRVFISPKFFTYYGPAKNIGNSLYICLNCPGKTKKDGKPMLYSCSDKSRKNLKSHLEAKHVGLVKSFEDACANEAVSATPSKRKRTDSLDVVPLEAIETGAGTSRQATLIQSFSSKKKAKLFTQAEFDDYVVDYIIDSVLPLRHVDTEPFKTIMQAIAPGYKVMCRQTLASKLTIRFKDAKGKIISKLVGIDHASTTADVWKSRGRSYMGVTGHWLDPLSLRRRSVCLGIRRVKGRHTYDVLAKMLESIHQEFGLEDKVRITVTDSGSNFLKAFRVFGCEESELTAEDSDSNLDEGSQMTLDESEYVEIDNVLDDWSLEDDQEFYKLPAHRKCACHLLNLIATVDVLPALQSPGYKKTSRSVFGKLQALFNKQSRSTINSDKIKEMLGVLFVTPNDTRWNSMFDSVRHIKKLIEGDEEKKIKQKLAEICDFVKVPKLSSQDYTFIVEYVTVMTPIAHALDVLQGEKGKDVTAGHLLPTIVVIRNALTNMKTKGELLFTLPLVDALLRGLKNRFDSFFNKEELQIASALHPKFKVNWLDEDNENDSILKRTILQKIAIHLKELYHAEEEKSQEENKDGEKQSPDDPKDFFSSLKKKSSQPAIESPWKMELRQFMEIKATENLDVLTSFPSVRKLFLKFNAGLPASAAVERLFSLGGRVLTPNRALLSDHHFEMLMFLKCNKELLD